MSNTILSLKGYNSFIANIYIYIKFSLKVLPFFCFPHETNHDCFSLCQNVLRNTKRSMYDILSDTVILKVILYYN